MLARKTKACRICKSEYQPMNSFTKVCSPKCALQFHKNQRDKEFRKETRLRKAAAKTKSQWIKETQTVFNRFIRLRDEGLPCISCGRMHQGQWHASHFCPTSTASQLRFNELNVWRACMPCNSHKSGNLIEYRKNLITKIGIDLVEWLETNNEPANWTIEELKSIKKYYQQRIKDLEALPPAG